MNRSSLKILICLLLICGILVVYWQVKNFDFIGFDDELYVSENRHVKSGLTAEGLVWAFTTFQSANWHPITWLSHMLDCELFGLSPGGHHWTNVQFHIANTLLLYFILCQMTGTLWRSAFVAALFALHPLHVESVAWVAERKDVLSTFFGILALISYCRYVKQPGLINYLLIVLFLGLGLMAKPMLVTFPFVFLLLDFWPLKRFQYKKTISLQEDAETDFDSQSVFMLIKEKIPLFILVAISSVLTFVAQQSEGAVGSLESFPIKLRIVNALVSYVRYVFKMFWPRNLSVFYPYPEDILPAWQVLGAAMLIVAAIFWAVRMAKHYPYLAVGLFWYLGTLVPVIGLVQVGSQAMADRYTYIPFIGIFIIIAWGASDLAKKLHFRKITVSLSAVVVLSVLTACAFLQVSYWQSGITLFKHALKVTDDNYVAYNNLGTAFGQRDLEEAIFCYKQALKIKPDYVLALYNLGTALCEQKKFDEAAIPFAKALRIKPNDTDIRNNLANVLYIQGKPEEAVFHYNEILKIDPEYAEAHGNMANVLSSQGRYDEAVFHYKEALRINPEYADAHYNFGTLLVKQGKIKEAVAHFAEAIKIDHNYVKAYNYIGVILAQQRKYNKAAMFFTKALKINPGYTAARKNIEVLKQIRQSLLSTVIEMSGNRFSGIDYQKKKRRN